MNIVIVEDEPVIAQRVQRQTAEILANHQPQIKWFDNFDDAESYLSEEPVDLLLLDLNLHGSDGFELLKLISAQSFHTVIISAYSEQAIRAFEFGVLDFVAKPFNKERLKQALERFTQQQRSNKTRFLAVKKASLLQIVELQQVCFINADGHYTQLHLSDGSEQLHDKAIDKLELLLPNNFFRIHRSYLVNLDYFDSLSVASGGSYQLILKNGTELPVSRTRYQQLKQQLNL